MKALDGSRAGGMTSWAEARISDGQGSTNIRLVKNIRKEVEKCRYYTKAPEAENQEFRRPARFWTDCPETVSYTHLDVYKRQAEIYAAEIGDGARRLW